MLRSFKVRTSYKLSVCLGWVILWVLFSINLSAIIFSDELYQETKRTSLKIAESCPATSCVVLVIGRSGVAHSYFLENLKEVSVQNLPLSNFRFDLDNVGPRKVKAKKGEYYSPLERRQLLELFRHFRFVLGNPQKYSGLTFKVLDYASSGRSLFSATAHLQLYFDQYNVPVKVKSLALSEHQDVASFHLLAERYGVMALDIDLIKIDPSGDLSYALSVSRFEDYAVVPQWDFKDHSIGRVDRDSAEAFYFHIQDKMKKDPVLQGRLALTSGPMEVSLENGFTWRCRKALKELFSF